MSREKCSLRYSWWKFTHSIYYKFCPGYEDHDSERRVRFFIWGTIWRFGVGFGGLPLTGVLLIAIFYEPFAINFHMTYIANALSVFDPIAISLTILVGLGMLTISLHSAIKSIYRCIALRTESSIDKYCIGHEESWVCGDRLVPERGGPVADYLCWCFGDKVKAHFYECRAIEVGPYPNPLECEPKK